MGSAVQGEHMGVPAAGFCKSGQPCVWVMPGSADARIYISAHLSTRSLFAPSFALAPPIITRTMLCAPNSSKISTSCSNIYRPSLSKPELSTARTKCVPFGVARRKLTSGLPCTSVHPLQRRAEPVTLRACSKTGSSCCLMRPLALSNRPSRRPLYAGPEDTPPFARLTAFSMPLKRGFLHDMTMTLKCP